MDQIIRQDTGRCEGRPPAGGRGCTRTLLDPGPAGLAIAAAADEVREKRAGNDVTWVRNQNINVTNLCVNACGFCGYSKKPGDEGIYFHDRAEIQKKARMAKERQVTEICTVSGLHPDFTAQSYIDVYRWIHEAAPEVHLHASNPMEVAYAAKKSGMTTGEVLAAMKGRAQLDVRDCRGDPCG